MYLDDAAIGEMLYMDPDQHTFINFITKYLGKGWGYFSGWSYWVSLVFLGMAEITAVSKLCPALVSKLASLADSNYLFSAFKLCKLDRCEGFWRGLNFWFGMIKIVTILALIVTGIFMVTTNFETPAGHASLTNITSGFQMFPNGWVKFVMAFQMVFFAYQAIEFVGITTSETANPRQVLPKAIKEIPIRIVIFYVGALLAIMAYFPLATASRQ